MTAEVLDVKTDMSGVSATIAFKTRTGVDFEASQTYAVKSAAADGTKLVLPEPKEGRVHGRGEGKHEIVSWGAGNLWPQTRKKQIEKHVEFAPLLEMKASLLLGLGLFPVRMTGFNTKTMEPVFEPVFGHPAFGFCWSRQHKRWLIEQATDLVWFRNTFSEVVMDAMKDRVERLAHHDATDCRVTYRKDSTSIEYVAINPDWCNYKQEHTKMVRAIDARKTDDVTPVRKEKKHTRYIYLSGYPSPGEDFYKKPSHEGYFESGWYDVAMAVPQFKKHLMKNQMNVAYHIEIDYKYFENKHQDWGKLSPEKKKERVQDELDTFEKIATGDKNSGITLFTPMEWMQHANAHRPMWKITALKGDSMEGKYIEDSREASSNLRAALGLDPTLSGPGPGRDGKSSGSGSDKWAALKIYLMQQMPMRYVLLEPMMFAFEYNGWTEEGIYPMIIDHPMLNTATASEMPEDVDAGNPNPKRDGQ